MFRFLHARSCPGFQWPRPTVARLIAPIARLTAALAVGLVGTTAMAQGAKGDQPAVDAAPTRPAPIEARTCEALRQGIEQRIRANGVTAPRVWVAEATAPVPEGAKVVGNCDQGARVILYSRTGGDVRPAAGADAPAKTPSQTPAAPRTPKRARGVIVECEVNGVVREGPCQR